METPKTGYQVQSYSVPVKRYCQTLDLRDSPELIAEYRKRHSQAEAWPEILAGIREVGILEMEIYILGTRLFMIVETPVDFDWDTAMARLNTLPRQQEWEEYMAIFQQAAPGMSSAEKWKPMERMFHLYNTSKYPKRTMKHIKQSILSKDGINYLIPFILITSCFALWGFANDITNPMVKAFSKIFRMSATDGALVQVAFYGGYFAMAFPAAMFIRKYSYKAGVLLGLGLYAFGAFLFFPAKMTGEYYPFLIAYFILTCGLSFLETSCNPYILSMGTEDTATRRLNLAQSFNPMGSLLGMYVAMQFIQAKLHPMGTEERALLNESEFQAIKESDLAVLIAPYLIIGLIIVAMLLLIRFVKMPKNGDQNHKIDFFPTLKRIFTQTRYREGVIAQFFYVGAQIMCWTFIIQYGTRLFMSPEFGMDEKSAEVLSQQYNIIAMIIFCISRFICTFILRYLNAGKLLMILAIFGGIFTLGTIFLQNIYGLYCLVAVSACMSLMFPTIYGIALKGLGDDAKFGAAGLIMAILGGSILPPLQASIIDMKEIGWLPAVNVSFILPFICFLVIIGYGYRTVKRNW